MIPFFKSLCLAAAALLLATPAPARDTKPGTLSLTQMRSMASLVLAQKKLSEISRLKITPAQNKSMRATAANLSKLIRRVSTAGAEDDEWTALTTPANYCVDLVLKLCGAEKQCGESQACGVALEWLDTHNALPTAAEQHEFEDNCVVTLQDNTVFPACQ